VGLVEDYAERILLGLKYLRLYGEIVKEIIRINREIERINVTNDVALKILSSPDGWLIHPIYPNRLLKLPEWYKLFYGLDLDRDYTLYAIYLYLDNISITFRDENGEDVYNNVSTMWIDPYGLVLMSILEDGEWRKLLEEARRYGMDLYDNILVYYEAATALRGIIYEQEPVNDVDVPDVEGVVLDDRLVEAVITEAEKVINNSSQFIRGVANVLDPPDASWVRFVDIDIRLLMDVKVTLPEWLARGAFFPCTEATVYWIDINNYIIRVWSRCNKDGIPYTNRRTISLTGTMSMADLILVSYMLTEDAWKKIIGMANHYLQLVRISHRKLEKAAVILSMFK
jgi:hypothetical protein